jgi:enoyl-CoA hydratase/carnithine racemase
MTDAAADLATHAGEESPLLMERRGAIVQITLNRPKARNALSHALLTVLGERLSEIAADTPAQVVVIDHTQPENSAGHDLRELNAHRSDADGDRGFYEQVMR